MLKAYKGSLRGNVIEWDDDAPPTDSAEVIVMITKEKRKPNPKAAIQALKKLAEMKAFASIEDPVAWQREIRKDRPLPGRD